MVEVQEATIVSSTGSLGLQVRGDNRHYFNWGGLPVTQASSIEGYLRRVGWIGDTEGRRDVFRGLVESQVIEELANRSSQLIEAAFPINEGVWYLNAARRFSSREPLRPIPEMVEEVQQSHPEVIAPIEAVLRVLSEKYTFTTTLGSKDIPQMVELWGETFGWDEEQLSVLVGRLQMKDPSVWFSAIRDDNGTLVAAAMAERIRLQKPDGSPFDVVESTEWRSTKRDHMKAVVDVLHAQVISDYAATNAEYVIIAECNVKSRAYRAGQKSGMIVPSVEISSMAIPQILVQNVTVRDGHKPEGLRDFALMYLPKENFSVKEAEAVIKQIGVQI